MTKIKIYPDKLPPLVTGPWKLQDLKDEKIGAPKHGLTVFSCFHCGGGSTMGYKLAGFKVLGGIEIDSEMMEIYRKNHHPDERFSFLMPIQDFPAIPNELLPKELFDLDILDGSPPCSSFSMAGDREDKWTEKRVFREGQTEQVLDDLFFHFIKVADKLKPKIVIAENVKGLIQGKARGYVRDIFKAFEKVGYDVQLFVLNSSRMGVPQKRERTFFIAKRSDIKLPNVKLNFEENVIPVSKAWDGFKLKVDDRFYMKKDSKIFSYWKSSMPGESMARVANGSNFNNFKLAWNQPSMTVTSSAYFTHPIEPRKLTREEYIRLQSFPDDYDFLKTSPQYVCGMSVPPFMTQRVATEIAKILLKKISN